MTSATKIMVFRVLTWGKYGLLLCCAYLFADVKAHDPSAVYEASFRHEQAIYRADVDQQTRIQQRQRQILDQYDSCAQHDLVLNAQTGECQ